jgi:hypothetical protein
MKYFIISFVLSILLTIISSAPTQINNNNIGDVVQVGVNANVDVNSQVDATMINAVLKAYLKQVAQVALDENGNPIPPNLPWSQMK